MKMKKKLSRRSKVISLSLALLTASGITLWTVCRHFRPDILTARADSSAAQCTDDGLFLYQLVNDTITVTGHADGLAGDVVIPGTVNEIPVTAIGECAFENCAELTSVYLPDSVEQIGARAFAGCGQLAEVHLANASATVAEDAFEGCGEVLCLRHAPAAEAETHTVPEPSAEDPQTPEEPEEPHQPETTAEPAEPGEESTVVISSEWETESDTILAPSDISATLVEDMYRQFMNSSASTGSITVDNLAPYNLTAADLDDVWNAFQQKYPIEAAAFCKYSFAGHSVGDTITKIVYNLSTAISGSFGERVTNLRNAVTPVLNKANTLSGNYEKALYIHDYLVKTCHYDLTNDTNLYRHYGYTILTGDKGGVCQAYQGAYHMFMNLLGIPSIEVINTDGTSAPTHGWNLIQLDGNWYHIDVTWDDSDTSDYVYYRYFLVNDAEIRAADTNGTHNVFNSPYPSSSTAYSAMPRSSSYSQTFHKGRWYYTTYVDNDGSRLCSCNPFGTDTAVIDRYPDTAPVGYNDVICYAADSEYIKVYWINHNHVGTLYCLSDEEKNQSYDPHGVYIYEMRCDSAGQVTYQYLVASKTTNSEGLRDYYLVPGQAPIDLAAFIAPFGNVYAMLDALPSTITEDSVQAAREALAAYDALADHLNELEETNLVPAYQEKAEALRRTLSGFGSAPATDIALSESTLTIEPGQTASLTAAVTPENSTDSVRWTSSDNTVASVSNGVITAKQLGTATITATVGTVSATCTVNVRTSLYITRQPQDVTTYKNRSTTFELEAAGDGLAYEWHQYQPEANQDAIVANSRICNVMVPPLSYNGFLYYCIVTDQYGHSVESEHVTLTVRKPVKPATSLTLSIPQTATTEPFDLTATLTPSDASDEISWECDDLSVAYVTEMTMNGTQNGLSYAQAVPVGNGTARIIARAGDLTAVCTLTVENYPDQYNPPSLRLSHSRLLMESGTRQQLTALCTSGDTLIWSSENTAIATVDAGGTVTAVRPGETTVRVTAGESTRTCRIVVQDPLPPESYQLEPTINGGASKLYEPWGLRYFAVFDGEDTDKISDRGIAILKDAYYTTSMTPETFCHHEKVHVFLDSRNQLDFETASSRYPNGRYYATLTDGIYSYDISAQYYVVPFAVMRNGQTIYGTIKKNSMENILRSNLNLSSISTEEKAVCTCILDLKASVASHYVAHGVPGATASVSIPRGSSQQAANVKTAEESGISPNVNGAASRLIEPWGLRYFSVYTESDDIADRGQVVLCEKYFQPSYQTNPDSMRLNPNAYIFRQSDGTLEKENNSSRYYSTLTEGISSKDISDVYYVVPFVVLNDGSYVYGTVKSNSMMKIMKANLNSSNVPATERAVSQDIIDLYNAVKAYNEKRGI
ncbi:MAG: Ig-like domain-containing protein [Clostridia bacterium]|nr:Ig-like domain-containing protein [Clostridia bacterium]